MQTFRFITSCTIIKFVEFASLLIFFYRYRFFGEDAEKAAKVLDIIAHPDSVGSGLLGLTASVPTFNGYSNYVRKLVLTGEKVGIVAQTESSAEKKVSQTSSTGPFSR